MDKSGKNYSGSLQTSTHSSNFEYSSSSGIVSSMVLDRGLAVGLGTHDELMRSCDVYREIALSQLSAAELAEGGKTE